jgi:DNA-binding XRE family transcriptional regulator
MWRDDDGRDVWAMRILGQWLREWRLATGATQRQVAQLAGVNQAHVCRIEQGKRRPSGIPLARIVIALDWLAGGGDRRGAWVARTAPDPSRAARWGTCRPPAVVGREPLPPVPADASTTLAMLLGELPADAGLPDDD